MFLLRIRLAAGALAGAFVALGTAAAHAHAVCGDRIFPATLAIDDPGVLDELTLPAVSYVPCNSDAAHEWDASFAWAKTIIPGLSVVIRRRSHLGAPGRLRVERAGHRIAMAGSVCLPDAEFMFKVGFDICWAGTGTGAQAGSAGKTCILQWWSPVLASERCRTLMKYLRPFADHRRDSARPPLARIGRTAIQRLHV